MRNEQYKKHLKGVLEKRCSGWIRTSGDGAGEVDCYGVRIKTCDEETINVSNFDGDIITLREYPNERAEDFTERIIRFSEVSHSDFIITHYLGLSRIEFHGLVDLYWSELFRIPTLLRWKDSLKTKVKQSRFNLKKFESIERIEFLKLLLKHNKKGVRFSTITELMLAEHGHEYFHHPRKEQFHEETRYLRNTIAELGEITEGTNGYFVTGKGYMAIVDSEEDERKHTENLMLQKKLVYLTIILAFTGIATGFEQIKSFIVWIVQKSASLTETFAHLW